MKTKPKAVEREVRFVAQSDLRLDQEGEAQHIRGYAARFNVFSEDLGWFREKIQPGAFSKTIGEADIRALWNHDPSFVLGRNRAGTLALEEDDQGLKIDNLPPDNSWANDLMVSMKRGDVNQMSFGFQTVRDEWNYDADPMERTLIECKLFDVSVVTYPAYPQTSAVVRGLTEDLRAQMIENDFDFDSLTGLFIRARRGVALSKADRCLIDSSIEILRACLSAESTPETTPAPATGHPGEGAPDSIHPPQAVRSPLSLLRKRLNLLEKIAC